MTDLPDETEQPVIPLAETDPQYRPLVAPAPSGVATGRFEIHGPWQSVNDREVKLHYYGVSPPGFIGEQIADIRNNNPFRIIINRQLPNGEYYIHYQYYSSSWSYWYYSGRFYVMQEVLLTIPLTTITYRLRPTIPGVGQPGARVQLFEVLPNATPAISNLIEVLQGRFDLTLNRDLRVGNTVIMAQQSVGQYAMFFTRHTLQYVAPDITVPTPNQLITSNQAFVFKGKGEYWSNVTVMTTATPPVAISESRRVAVTSGLWETPAIASALTTSGTLTVQAHYEVSGASIGRSAPVTFRVLGQPAITSPGANSEQPMTFTVSGNNGLQGSRVDLYYDLDPSSPMLGNGTVTAAPAWSASVTLWPGVRSLVAVQSQGGVSSQRGALRVFRIRPPALTNVTVTEKPNNALLFSGQGYYIPSNQPKPPVPLTVTVTVTKVSGPGGPASFTANVNAVNGQWEYIAQGFVPGAYVFSATQQVPDNAGQSIRSPSYQFSYQWKLPAPYAVTHNGAYQPVFSGSGYDGGTIRLADPGGASNAAPNAFVAGTRWSSTASTVWGPTKGREVHLQQQLNGQVSEGWVVLTVDIKPLAPTITELIDNGYTPTFKGTCWSGAVVSLKFSGDTRTYTAIVTGSNWTFIRPTPFEPDINHTVDVTQRAAEQDSLPTRRSFSVNRILPQPLITAPEQNDKVGRSVLIEGRNGVQGGQVKIRERRFSAPGEYLGESLPLDRDGDWSVQLTNLSFLEYHIEAIQFMGSRASTPSEERRFEVVVLPPDIEVPMPDGPLPRHAVISGSGLPGARVTVWLVGSAEPLFQDAFVDALGHWEGPAVTLDIGNKTLRAQQIYDGRVSEERRHACRVVPAAPLIETPVATARVGRQVVVSGFGYVGDQVTVRLNDAPQTVLGSAPVASDRTWSVAVELDRTGGMYSLLAVQSQGTFHSDTSVRPVALGTYRPTLDVPAPGRWVYNPVGFSGRGQPGVGELVSWYNPEYRLAVDVAVTAQGWQAQSVGLPVGGCWARFRQVIHSPGQQTYSDWADSARFEVLS